jgi:hypothetical protein
MTSQRTRVTWFAALLFGVLQSFIPTSAKAQTCDVCRQRAAESRRVAAQERAQTVDRAYHQQAAAVYEQAAQNYDLEYAKCSRNQPNACASTVSQSGAQSSPNQPVSSGTANAQQQLGEFNRQMTGTITNARQRLEGGILAFQRLIDGLLRAPPISTSPFRGVDFERIEADAELTLTISRNVSATLYDLEQRLRKNAADATSEAERNWYLNQANEAAAARRYQNDYARMMQEVHQLASGRARSQRQFATAGPPAMPTTGGIYEQPRIPDPPDDIAQQRRREYEHRFEDARWQQNSKGVGKPCRFTDAPPGIDPYGSYDQSGNCAPREVIFPDPGGRRTALPMQAEGWFPGGACRFTNPSADISPTGRFDAVGNCIPDEIRFGAPSGPGSREAIAAPPRPGEVCQADDLVRGGKVIGRVGSDGSCVAPEWRCEKWSIPVYVQISYGERKAYAGVVMQMDAYVTAPPDPGSYYQTAKFTAVNHGSFPVRVRGKTLRKNESDVFQTPPDSPRDRLFSIQVSACIN